MKLFNLCDVSTPALEGAGLVGAGLAVQRHIVPSGESIEVEDGPQLRREVQGYVNVGAMSVDVLPPSYVLAKARLVAAKEQEVKEQEAVRPPRPKKGVDE